MLKRISPQGLAMVAITLCLTASSSAIAANSTQDTRSQRIIKHWTSERIASAIPRDLVIDSRGLGYLRKPGGELIPYGHNKLAQLSAKPVTSGTPPVTKAGGLDENTPPTITNMLPAQGDIIGDSYTFSATIRDELSNIRSVTFVITYPDGITTQTFRPGYAGNDQWQMTLSGFSNGQWSWHVVARDSASKGGNTATSAETAFTVDTTSGGTGGGNTGGDTTDSYIVTNAQWTSGSGVQTAAGRLYFEMPGNRNRKGPWNAYVCSGTTATDNTSGRSVIITASHCVYDDSNKAFARNVLFIPNQQGTTGTRTDVDCNNDPMGCWTPRFGVIDINWSNRVFPDNIAWDYAYYVVSDTGAHSGSVTASDSLDQTTGSLMINFAVPIHDDGDPSASSADFTYALGYSYSDDPNFMFCAEDMTTEGNVNWWLPSCGLSGGSSGGPWVQPMDTTSGTGAIISVNSWGYTGSPGMAGPKLSGTSASCLFSEATGIDLSTVSSSDGDAGVIIDYCP